MPPLIDGSDSFLKHFSALVSATARVGLGRLIAQATPWDVPPPFADEARASAATAKEMAGFIDEFAVAGRSASEAGELKSLDGSTSIVLTAEQGNAAGWMAKQDAMTTLSTNSLHKVVPGATHASLLDDPNDAAVVSQAIDDVVQAIGRERHSQPGEGVGVRPSNDDPRSRRASSRQAARGSRSSVRSSARTASARPGGCSALAKPRHERYPVRIQVEATMAWKGVTWISSSRN